MNFWLNLLYFVDFVDFVDFGFIPIFYNFRF